MEQSQYGKDKVLFCLGSDGFNRGPKQLPRQFENGARTALSARSGAKLTFARTRLRAAPFLSRPKSGSLDKVPLGQALVSQEKCFTASLRKTTFPKIKRN